jgi:hypothetical protein
MLVYDYFAETRQWQPAIVDELDLDQLYWLPVMKAARAAAIEQLRDRDK